MNHMYNSKAQKFKIKWRICRFLNLNLFRKIHALSFEYYHIVSFFYFQLSWKAAPQFLCVKTYEVILQNRDGRIINTSEVKVSQNAVQKTKNFSNHLGHDYHEDWQRYVDNCDRNQKLKLIYFHN